MTSEALKLKNQLCFPLYAVSRLVIKQYKPYLDPLELTYTQYIVLLALWEEDGLTVSQLGDLLYLDSGTLTPLLKKLEQQHRIERRRGELDERQVYIFLTPEGHDLQEKASHVPLQAASHLTLSKEEAGLLHTLLHKMLQTQKSQLE